ncbi:MAG: hypothetical protein KC441_00010 [Anaerolineales bacterium]|nr:hypothetical protein [Anaerolineales bacterium]
MTQETKTKTGKQDRNHRGNGSGMKPLAEELVRYHKKPAPETAVPYPRPFPHTLWLGLWSGIVIGAVAGLIFGWLLYTGAIAPAGWEAIFSLSPVTFHFFWTMMGLSLGMLIGGLAAILATGADGKE